MTNISFRSNIHATCNPFLGVLGGWGGVGRGGGLNQNIS